MTQMFDMYLRGEYQATVFMPSREGIALFTSRFVTVYQAETGERAPYPEEIRYVQRDATGTPIAAFDSTGGYLDSYPLAESVSRGHGSTFLTDSEGGEI